MRTVQLFHCFEFLIVIRFYKYFKFCAEVLNINYYKYMVALVVICSLFYWHITCCLLMFFRLYLSSKKYNLMFVHARTIQSSFISEMARSYPEIRTLISAYYRGSLIIYNSSYGNDLPSTEAEILLIWFGWYLSSLFFIYILALIMEIMKGQTSAAHKYVEMERQLKDYMRHKQLPMLMRSRILTYYEFRFQKSYFREAEILETISEQLRQEINMHACRKLVENVIFFRNLPINLLVRIISCLRIEVYLVNDMIIKANTPGTSMYFISTGTVAVYTKSGKEICHLEDGSHFGEIALIIKDTLRTASVIAVEVSEIYRLDQKDFVKAINPYPDLLANIQHIAAERMEVASMLDEYNKKEHTAKRS
ncbi:potassium/sodium hyperpolarization-activated cyclic nucleotide-gated channel 2-like [Rhynchophorus ferrugineus]